jgi:TP901 family phage tail tape measure protein
MSQVGTLSVGLLGDMSGLSKSLKDAEDKLKGFGKSFDKMGASASKSVNRAAIAATAAVTAFGVSAVKTFVEFDTGMREVFTLLPDLSESARKQMTEDVRRVAQEIAILPQKVVPALYQAISAGVPKENVFEFLEVAGKAAKAGVTELEVAVDGLTSAVNAYGAEILPVEEAADIMFTAVKFGKTTFDELSARLFQAVPIAAKVGLEFRNVAGAAAQITLAGVPMQIAMTQIRSLLNDIAFEGKELNKVFVEAAGVSFQEYIGAGHDIADVIEVLEGAARNAGKSIAEMTGNVEAQGALLNLSGGALMSLRGILDEMTNSTGAADEAFGTMAGGIKYALDDLKVWWTNLKLDIGEQLTESLDGFLKWLEGNREKIAGGIKAIFDVLTRSLQWMVDHSALVKAAGIAIAAGITAIYIAANPVKAAIVGLVGGIALLAGSMPSFSTAATDLSEASESATKQVGLLGLAIEGLMQPIADARDRLQSLAPRVRPSVSALEDLENRVWLLITSFENMEKAGMLTEEAAAALREEISQLYEDLKDAPDLEAAMQHWGTAVDNVIAKFVDEFPQLARLLSKTEKAIEDVGESSEDTEKAVEELVKAFVTEKFDAANETLKTMKASLTAAEEGSLDYIIAVQQIQAEYTNLIAARDAIIAQDVEVSSGLEKLIDEYEALPIKLKPVISETKTLGQALADLSQQAKVTAADFLDTLAGNISSAITVFGEGVMTMSSTNKQLAADHKATLDEINTDYNESVIAAAEARDKALQNLKDNLVDGKLAQETYGREVGQVWNDYTKAFKQAEKDREQALDDEKAAYEEHKVTIGRLLSDLVHEVLLAIARQLLGYAAKHAALALINAVLLNPVRAAQEAGAALIAGTAAAGMAIFESALPFDKGGIVAGALGEPVPAIVHGGEMVLTPEQQRGIIDYQMMSAAMADALEEVLPGKDRPLYIVTDGKVWARTMLPFLQNEERRLGLVTP